MSIQDLLDSFKKEPDTKLARDTINELLLGLTDKQKLENKISDIEFYGIISRGCTSASKSEQLREQASKQIGILKKQGKIIPVKKVVLEQNKEKELEAIQITEDYLPKETND